MAGSVNVSKLDNHQVVHFVHIAVQPCMWNNRAFIPIIASIISIIIAMQMTTN